MPTVGNKVHVSRKGALLGAYEFDQLGDMMERGQLQKTDHFYDEATTSWIPLSEWKEPGGAATSGSFKTADQAPLSEDAKSGRRRGSRSARAKKEASQSAMIGWIAALFALVVAGGIVAYALTIQGSLKLAEGRIKDLEARNESLRKENQLMAEVTPSGRVRAIITYEPSPEQVAIMSGATVGLYKRSDVEAALTKAGLGDLAASNEAFDQGIESLKSAISSPIQVTLTDSNGRVDLTVPEPGDYVLVASAGKSTPTGTERYLWLMGFSAQGQPSSMILMNENNAFSVRKPNFSIVNIPSMQAGTPP